MYYDNNLTTALIPKYQCKVQFILTLKFLRLFDLQKPVLKMKRKILGIAAIAIALSASAFTTTRSNTLYKFNGNSSNIGDASAYTEVSTPPAGCNTGITLPCYLSVSGDLQTWLDARTDAQIVAAAPAKKQ